MIAREPMFPIDDVIFFTIDFQLRGPTYQVPPSLSVLSCYPRHQKQHNAPVNRGHSITPVSLVWEWYWLARWSKSRGSSKRDETCYHLLSTSYSRQVP
jgi:hypothetical protein